MEEEGMEMISMKMSDIEAGYPVEPQRTYTRSSTVTTAPVSLQPVTDICTDRSTGEKSSQWRSPGRTSPVVLPLVEETRRPESC